MLRRRAPRSLILWLGLSMLTMLLGSASPVAAAEPAGYEYFHTYAETEAVIDNVVAAHPSIAQKFSIGRSYEGRDIWAIKLTSNVSGPTNDKPEIMINALMHARERASSELAIYMLQVLANNYGLAGSLGTRVTNILNTRVVFVIPMMNPDGAEYDFSGGRFHNWRKNRQPTPDPNYMGIDLNRQFGYTWNCCGGSSGKPSSDYYHGPSAFYTPEDQAYRDFVDSQVVDGKSKITEILSLHSAAREVLWPYSYTKADVPSDMTADDHAAFVALGKGIAQRDGYRPKQGSDLYIVDGDQDDWAYGTYGIFAITIELPKGAAKRYYPSLNQINAFNNQNRSAVLWYLEQADCPYRAAGLAATVCGSSANAQYYSQSVFDANAVQPQQTNCWCAVASTRAMLESANASISVAQTDVNDFMATYDKENWTDPAFGGFKQCAMGSPSPSYAHDGRGMAWALWNWATSDQSAGYNDYAGTDQAAMDWQIVRGIRATNQPVSAIVAYGKHAILAVGYQTAMDPLNDGGAQNSILGIRVWDPWYGAGFGSWAGWPASGFAGNSYVTIGDWNTRYFTADLNEGPYYAGKYVAVMRSSVAEPPNDNPAQSYGDWLYSPWTPNPTPTPTPDPTPTDTPTPTPTDTPTPGPTDTPTPTPTDTPTPGPTDTPAPTDTPTPTPGSAPAGVDTAAGPAASPVSPFAAPAAAATIAQAVADGINAYQLLGDPELGNLPATYTVGTIVPVRSLAVGLPSYDLVELRVGGVVRAVALVNEANGGYVFGELRATNGDVRLPTQAQLGAQLTANGLHGVASLSWTWTDDVTPPFAPFLTGLDAAGRTAFVTPRGVVEQLPVVNGVTPVAN